MDHTQRSLKRPGITRRPQPNVVHRMSSDGIMKLQLTIGNQAVQRLLQRRTKADSHADVQRAPGGKEDNQRPYALATFVLSSKRKLNGSSRITGHEGKIELLSFAMAQVGKPNARESESEEQFIEYTVSKNVDQTSQSLMEAATKGEHITSAKFELIRQDAEGKVEVSHTFDFSEGLITGYQFGGSGDSSDKPIEVYSIQFPMKPKK